MARQEESEVFSIHLDVHRRLCRCQLLRNLSPRLPDPLVLH